MTSCAKCSSGGGAAGPSTHPLPRPLVPFVSACLQGGGLIGLLAKTGQGFHRYGRGAAPGQGLAAGTRGRVGLGGGGSAPRLAGGRC